jgi:hypothetical protein
MGLNINKKPFVSTDKFNYYEVDSDKIPYYNNLGHSYNHKNKKDVELKDKWKKKQSSLRRLFKKDLEDEFGLTKYIHKKKLWNFAVWSGDFASDDHYDYEYIYEFYKRFITL